MSEALFYMILYFSRKRYPFRIPSIDEWYPFNIPCLELSIISKNFANLSVDNFQLSVTAGFLHSYFLCLPLDFRTILKSILSGLCTQLRMPIQRRQIWAHSTLAGEYQQISKTWSLWPWLQQWHLPPLPWWCHPHLLFLRLNQQVMTDVNINNIVPDSN